MARTDEGLVSPLPFPVLIRVKAVYYTAFAGDNLTWPS